jgi:phosphoglycolate phosphatase-like HAD superfamily hydrolase
VTSGAVAWGYAAPDFLRAQRPDYFFASMDEIRRAATGTPSAG